MNDFRVFENDRSAISIVTVGELYSFARQKNWGKAKTERLEELIDGLIVIPIQQWDIVKRYAEIDVFSQGKDTEKPIGITARNMSKNDLWIAATASVTKATLVTADRDFEHLVPHFCSVEMLSIRDH